MVHRDRRNIPRERQRTPDRRANQQRADQTRACGIGNGIDIFALNPASFSAA
jgi:hypothetical protein